MFKQYFSGSKSSLILLIFYLLPILITFGYIIQFGVNIPSYDQWVLPKLFEKIATNQLHFSDLFELHNNHRILFPRLIFISLAFLSDWNIKWEMFFSLGLAVCTFFALVGLASLTNLPSKSSASAIINSGDHVKVGKFRNSPQIWGARGAQNNHLFHLSNLLTCFLIFNLNQEWLWGFQLPIFLINFCLILACLTLSINSLNHKLKLAITAIFCGVASFSSVQGLLTWLAVIPLVLSQNESRKKSHQKQLLLWLSGFATCCGIYAIGYQQEPRIIALSLPEYLLTFVTFFLNILAAPIVQSPALSIGTGLSILALFLGILVYGLKQNKSISKFYTPWLSIGLFSLLTSLLTTWGRVEWGGDYPLSATRYTTHSLLLLISLVHLSRVLISNSQTLNNPRKISHLLTSSFCAGILFSFILVSSQSEVARVTVEKPLKQRAETCLYLFNYLEDSEFFKTSPDRCLLAMSKSTWWIQDGVESLQNIGLRDFAENIPFVSKPSQVYGYIDNPEITDTPIKINKSDSIQVGGWAILPEQKQQPNLVFLSYGEQNSFFANADVVQESPDIAEFFNSNRYRLARWVVIFSGESLPIGETEIKAWIYDPQQQQFVKLQSEVKISTSAKSTGEL
ncbi:MAG: hypothetical protein AAFO04_15130 [Cyanobacteria bacterium J06592_8]